VSLCWQNMEPVEGSDAVDCSVNGRDVAATYNEPAESRRVSAQLLVWLQSLVPGFRTVMPVRAGQERNSNRHQMKSGPSCISI